MIVAASSLLELYMKIVLVLVMTALPPLPEIAKAIVPSLLKVASPAVAVPAIEISPSCPGP